MFIITLPLPALISDFAYRRELAKSLVFVLQTILNHIGKKYTTHTFFINHSLLFDNIYYPVLKNHKKANKERKKQTIQCNKNCCRKRYQTLFLLIDKTNCWNYTISHVIALKKVVNLKRGLCWMRLISILSN